MVFRNKRDSTWHEDADHLFAGAERKAREAVVAAFAKLLRPSRKSVPLQDVRRILVIKEPYRMGDLMQITPSLRALRRRFPDAFIGLVVQDRNEPIFRYNRHVDEVFAYEKKRYARNPFALLFLMRRIRAQRFDLAVTLETERVHLTNDLIAYFSGAPFRLRYDSTFWDNGRSNCFYNVIAPLDMRAVHRPHRNFGVLKALGLELDDASLVLALSEFERTAARRALAWVGLSESDFYVAIHPGAYKFNNRWPLANFLALAKGLAAGGRKVLFLLGPSESEWRDEIERSGFPVLSDLELLITAAVLALAQVVICNDTGILHLAGGLGVKTVSLFAGTDPAEWKPAGAHVIAIRSPDHRIESIPVSEVLSAVAEKAEVS